MNNLSAMRDNAMKTLPSTQCTEREWRLSNRGPEVGGWAVTVGQLIGRG